MDNQNTAQVPQEWNAVVVLILVLMDNQNTPDVLSKNWRLRLNPCSNG